MALSDTYDDLADSYSYTADMDRSLGALAFDLGESALARWDFGDAMAAFAEGAQDYANAAEADAAMAIYRSIATALRAAGK